MPEMQAASPSMPASAIEALRSYNESESPRAIADLEAEAGMRERLFGMPAEYVQAPYVFLCSIWPERLVSPPYTHGGVGRKFYYLEPGSPEKPFILPLQNTFDMIIVQQGVGEVGHQPGTITAAQIAKDLIAHWTGDHPANRKGKKGIGVIKGHFDKGQVFASPQEIAELDKLQRAFLTFLVERADEYWDSGRPGDRDKITSEHRKALKMLGLDESQHPWLRSKVQQFNQCPACAERILAEANRCRHCQTNLIAYFMEMDEIPHATQWPSVVKGIERMTKKK